MAKLFSFFQLLCLGLSIGAYAQNPCPPEGSATDPVRRQLNINKNQSAAVPKKKAVAWDIKQVINADMHDDKNDFEVNAYVTLNGYLVSFKEEGPESCNCKEADAGDKTGDVHIYIGLHPDAPKNECVVVEITPDFKRLHPDYEKYLHNNVPITITGYLLYDLEHRPQATNTCNKCTTTWRKTCWEIHPITAIKKM